MKVKKSVVSSVEKRLNLKDIEQYGQCKYCHPGDFSALEDAKIEAENCKTCILFDLEGSFCRNHLEFIASPEFSVCYEFGAIKAFNEKKRRNPFLYH